MTPGKPWTLVLTAKAEKDLKGIPAADQARILAALDGLLKEPPEGDVRKLQGQEERWRLRVGDWRAIFSREASERTVTIRRILNRRDAYRG